LLPLRGRDLAETARIKRLHSVAHFLLLDVNHADLLRRQLQLPLHFREAQHLQAPTVVLSPAAAPAAELRHRRAGREREERRRQHDPPLRFHFVAFLPALDKASSCLFCWGCVFRNHCDFSSFESRSATPPVAWDV